MLQFSNFQRCMVIGVNDERLAMKGSILLYLWALLMVEIEHILNTTNSHNLSATSLLGLEDVSLLRGPF